MARRLYENIRSTSPAICWPLTKDYQLTDVSGNGRNATYTNGPNSPGGVSPITADPYEGYLDLSATDLSHLDSGYNPFSAAGWSVMWIMNSTAAATAALDMCMGAGTNGPSISFGASSTTMTCSPDRNFGDTATVTSARPGVGVTAIFHVIHDNANKKFYVFRNGALLNAGGTSIANSRQTGASPGNFTFSSFPQTNCLTGSYAWVTVWNRPIGQAEVAATSDARVRNQYSGSSTRGRMLNQSPAPSLYIPFNAQYGINDQSSNGRNAFTSTNIWDGNVGGGLAPKPVVDPQDTSTSSNHASGLYYSTNYAPFAAGTTIAACGLAYRLNTSFTHMMWGATGAGYPQLSITSGNQNVIFSPDAGTTLTTFTAAWPGLSQWVAWALSFNPSTDAVVFKTLTVPSATVTTASSTNTADFSSAGNITIGGNFGGNSWDGYFAHFAFWAGTIPSSLDQLLDVLVRAMPGRVVESP